MLERRSIGYGVAALLLQGLVACGPSSEVGGNSIAATTTPAPVAPAATPTGPARLILAFGDSLYAGYGLERGQSLPDGLQVALREEGINATVMNAGVSGDTSAAGRRRLAFALDNLSGKPDLVLLGLGGNDVLRQIPPEETRANLVAMLDLLRERQIPVVLTGMRAPPNLGPEFTGRFDAIYPDLAKQYGAGLYPFILDGVIGDGALMLPDGVHPNAMGVTRIVGKLAPVVREGLEAR